MRQCVLCAQTDKRTSKPKVWIYKDKNSGVPKGEATITFDDPETAKAAIDWFDGKNTAEATYSQLPASPPHPLPHIVWLPLAGARVWFLRLQSKSGKVLKVSVCFLFRHSELGVV